MSVSFGCKKTFFKAGVFGAAVACTTVAALVEPARDVAERLCAQYRAHDVPAMVALFAPEGVIEYVPLGLSGPAEEIGPGSWGVLIDAFPDLTNVVNRVWSTDDGRTAVVGVNIAGTQEKNAFGVPNLGRRFDLRHLFAVTTIGEGRITEVTRLWDNVAWFRQLGQTTLD